MIGIWFFTGTGKCKQIAEKIKSQITDYEIEIKDITPLGVRNVLGKSILYDKLIIVFPVHGGDVPYTLKDFFNELNGNGAITILVALWGNVHSGKALYNTKEVLQKHNFRVVAGAEILAEHSFSFDHVRLAGGKPTKQETDELISFVKRNLDSTDDSVLFQPAKESLQIALLMLLRQGVVPRMTIKMILDNEKCLQCKLCQKNCPVGAIAEDMSIENKRCVRCLSCETNCPIRARTHQFSTGVAKIFLAKNQYHINENKYFEPVK